MLRARLRNNQVHSYESRIRPLLGTAAGLFLLTEALGQTPWLHAPHHYLSLDPNRHSPFFAFAVAAIFALHLQSFGRAPHVLAALAAGLILAALHAGLFFSDASFHWLGVSSTCAYYLGIGSALMLTWQSWRTRGTPSGRLAWQTLRTGILLPMFVMTSWPWLEATYTFHPDTYDAVLYRFEDSLGFQSSAAVGRWFEPLPLLAQLSYAVYAGLPLFAAILHGLQLRRCSESADILKVFLAIAVAGFALYFAFPAAGPLYLVGNAFPHHIPDPAGLPTGLAPLAPAYRNAMPSLHMAWALALCLGSRGLGTAVRTGFVLLAVGTAIAALGQGEHYLIDLVVAIPFAVAVHSACQGLRSPGRVAAVAGGAAMVAAWLAYLASAVDRFEHAGPAHWIAMAATIAITFLLWRNTQTTALGKQAPAENHRT